MSLRGTKTTRRGPGGQGRSRFWHSLVVTDRLDNIADIQSFAKFCLYSSPAKWLPGPTGRDIGHCLDRHPSPRSMGSVDRRMRLDKGHRGSRLSRLGSNMSVHVSLWLSGGSKLIGRQNSERACLLQALDLQLQ